MKAILLISFFCLSLTAAFSQGLNFININTDQGLPSNECYRIVQDARGYIWISTEAGLVRYNSKEFVLFNTDKGMPSNNDIYALDVDAKGRVWFATGKWKIGYILNDSVHVLPDFNFYNENRKSGDIIYKIKYDASANCLYVSTHYQTITIEILGEKYISRPLDTSNTFSNKYMIVGDNYAGNVFNKVLFSKYATIQNYDTIYALVNFKDSSLLPVRFKNHFFAEAFSGTFNTNSFFIGIQFHVFLFNKKEMKVLSEIKLTSQIQSLHVSKSKKDLWVGCKKDGLLFFKHGDITQKPVHILQGLSISNIAEDSEGGIWVTTLEKGVFYCSNTLLFLNEPLFGINSGITLCKSINGKLFLSNDAIPLAIIDKDTTFISKLSVEKNTIVTDIVGVANGYYVSTTTSSYYLDIKKNRIVPIYHRYTKALKILVPFTGMFSDSLGTCYGYNNIYLGKYKSGEVISSILDDGPKIKHALLLNNKEALFCTRMGLYHLNLLLKEYQKIETPPAKKLHDINKIYRDPYGNFWLPSNNDTLIVLDRNFNLKTAISLCQTNISSRNILQINPTTFFVSTNKGVLQVQFVDTSLSKYNLQYFDKTNGLTSNDIYNIVPFKGKLYASTSKGLCVFNKPEDLQHISPPNTIINKCTVNDSSITLSGPHVFSYKKNNLTFQIDALAFKKIGQRGAFFKYRLDGLENEFKAATGNTISYNNLPPGTYTFIAKTFYDSNTEDTTPATFSFTIKPAFWQTWWGILLMALAGAALIFLFIQWRIKKIKQSEKAKAKIDQTIAEYKFTALKAQMDPHFVFNSINVIQNLILEKDKTEAYNSLGKFSRLIRMVLNQSDSVFATIEEELALINLYVELNQLRVDYPFTFDSEIQEGLLACTIPSLIIQPFVENALWHGILPLKGKKGGTIVLKIFKEGADILVMQLEDNGIGRKASALNKSSLPHISKGTELIRERLIAYRAMNNNCLAELNIFDLEENAEANGTLVEIKIAILHDES